MRPRHLANRAFLAIALLLGVSSAMAAEPAPAGNAIRFFSHHNADAYLLYFFGQDGSVQKERFVTEGALHLEFSLASWNEGDDLAAVFHIVTGMGDSVTDNLPFSPKEMAYELSPVFQHRGPEWLYRAGWVHACQHLIYKDDANPWYLAEDSSIPPDLYYNRLFLGFGTPEARPEVLRQTFLVGNPGARAPWLIWYGEGGYYLRSLGDLIEPDSLYDHNDWAMDFKADIGVPIWKSQSAVLIAGSHTHLLFDTDSDTYLRESLELAAHFASTGYGTSLVLGNRVVDEHPRDSKEGVWEIGVRFYY
jgi:hypothetical protein